MDRACARSPSSAIPTSSSAFRCGRPPATGSCSSCRQGAQFVVGDPSRRQRAARSRRARLGACWSGDGRSVYYTSERDGIQCIAKVPAEGGTPIMSGRTPQTTAVTPDGQTLYYVHRPRSDSLDFVGDLEICSAAVGGGSSSVMARVSSGRVPLGRHLFQPFLSPDGRWLAAPLTDGATSNVWVLPTSGGPMRALTDFGDRRS